MENNFKKFILFWIGQFVASIGHGLTAFSLGVYAYSIANSAFDSSMVMLLAFLPSVILLLPAGVLADNYDRRLMMILGDGLSALGVLFILLMKAQGTLHLVHIYIGVVISAVFSSLMQPAYQATVTDLLTEEQYTKASGLVQIASASRFLISPILAGILLSRYGLELILIIDISTIIITVISSMVVRKNLPSKEKVGEKDFFKNLKEGWAILKSNKGAYTLTLIATALTFFIGILQTLSNPYFLSFSNSEILGKSMSISAVGMLVSGLLIGVFSIKDKYVDKLCISLFLAGIFMVGFGYTEVVTIITISGFLFFAMMPVTNTVLDYLIRSNIENKYQGRVWGFIGFISQMGYAIAYPLAGILADKVFTPALMDDGILADSVGKIISTGPSRGIGFVIILSGILLSIVSLFVFKNKPIRGLETYSLKQED